MYRQPHTVLSNTGTVEESTNSEPLGHGFRNPIKPTRPSPPIPFLTQHTTHSSRGRTLQRDDGRGAMYGLRKQAGHLQARTFIWG